MVNIDFSLGVSIYAVIFLGLLLIDWFFGRHDRQKDMPDESRLIWFCSICAYTYINTKEEAISACPRCGSYNKK